MAKFSDLSVKHLVARVLKLRRGYEWLLSRQGTRVHHWADSEDDLLRQTKEQLSWDIVCLMDIICKADLEMFDKTGGESSLRRCPHCDRLMFVRDDTCLHCGRFRDPVPAADGRERSGKEEMKARTVMFRNCCRRLAARLGWTIQWWRDIDLDGMDIWQLMEANKEARRNLRNVDIELRRLSDMQGTCSGCELRVADGRYSCAQCDCV